MPIVICFANPDGKLLASSFFLFWVEHYITTLILTEIPKVILANNNDMGSISLPMEYWLADTIKFNDYKYEIFVYSSKEISQNISCAFKSVFGSIMSF